MADRSWAISQNLLIGGRNVEGEDLTNLTSYALLDAYYDMNLPQALFCRSSCTRIRPKKLYESLGKVLLYPGMPDSVPL